MRFTSAAVFLTILSQMSSIICLTLDNQDKIISSFTQELSAAKDDDATSRQRLLAPTSHDGFAIIEKRGPETIDVCFRRTLADPENYDANGWRDPATWWEAPEWYVWVNGTCVWPGRAEAMIVYCRKIRRHGNPFNGSPFRVYANCPVDKPICDNTFSELDPNRPTGHLVPDVTCLTSTEARTTYVLQDRTPKTWCSDPEQLGAHPSRIGSSYMLTMEVQPSSGKRKGKAKDSEMWFEVAASWWKYSHRLADRVGRVTSAIINTAPALGKTTVRFCALLNADTTSHVLPRVAIIYSAALIGKHRNIHPPGGPHAQTAIKLDVEKEPEDLVIVLK